jgi:concentrative nucleoside transporter, CNT family
MQGGLDNLRSLLGIAVIIALGVALSENRRAIRWRIIGSGLLLQAVFGLIVLKTEPGIRFFEWIAHGVNRLMDFTQAGSEFVFGGLARADGPAGFVFVFRVLPSVIFVGALMSVLYHLGLMQRVVQGMSWVMAKIMGVSGAESLAAAVNVFVGQTEAPLVIRPYVPQMTRSELMALMVGGFATVAGGVLVAYVSMGVSAAHLITASLMSAPASLLMAKLLVPETENALTLGKGYVAIEKVSVNVVDAAASGASDGVKLAINVAGMLIAFIALVALVDALLGAAGSAVGIENLTLARMLGLVFYPLAFAVGVPEKDCLVYGGLLGTQISLNEFVAYLKLTSILPTSFDDTSFSPRSVMLATYSLCGFANFGSIGIQLGGIGALAEGRRHDLARLGVKAMLGGFLACNLTAAVAGTLVTNAEAEYRHALAIATKRIAAGELDAADALLLDAARRNAGSSWAEKAAEKAAKVATWREAVKGGTRPIVEVQRERL